MNHLFTLKARAILLACLLCQFGIKVRATQNANTNTAWAAHSDTTRTKKGDTSFSITADTSLAIKAGSTMVIKADTTLVINADAALIGKIQDAIAKKADAVAVAPEQKTDMAAVVPEQKADVAKTTDNTYAANPTVIAPPADGIIQVRNTVTAPPADGVIEVRNAAGTLEVKDMTASGLPTASASPVQKTENALTENQDNATKDTQLTAPVKDSSAPAGNMAATTVATTDAATTNGAASTVKTEAIPAASTNADTTLAKKADTALMDNDTTHFSQSDTTIVQKDTTGAVAEIKAQSLYLEVGGAGLAISANFDSRFNKQRNGWGYRVGLGYFGSGGNTVFTIPFQINYLVGAHSHMFELGAGTTFLNSTGTNAGNSKWEFDRVTGFIGTATIGYRFQPAHSGINVRVAFTPILYDEGLLPIGGISVGYTFK